MKSTYHPIYQYGAPNPNNHPVGNLQPEYVVSRTLMRNPSTSVRANLELLHTSVKSKFGNMTDEALEWLLGGVGKNSRGSFRTATEFRNFLNQPAANITSSRLISALESVATAIGYRYDRVHWAEEPYYPETIHQQAAAEVIDNIMWPERMPDVGRTYPQRGDDHISDIEERVQKIHVESQYVSDASDDDEPSKQPKERLDVPNGRNFRVISKDGTRSWIAKAEDDGILTRSHISGSAHFTCAAVEGLLRMPDGSHILGDQDARDLYTALLIPHYQRSDFHSIAETETGIEHYIAWRNHIRQFGWGDWRDGKPSSITPIEPKVALENAMEAMIRSTRDTLNPGEEFTPRQAMEQYREQLLAKRSPRHTLINPDQS